MPSFAVACYRKEISSKKQDALLTRTTNGSAVKRRSMTSLRRTFCFRRQELFPLKRLLPRVGSTVISVDAAPSGYGGRSGSRAGQAIAGISCARTSPRHKGLHEAS